jgi:hypothetical protein
MIGPRTLAQLDSQLVGADLRLDDDVLDAIDDVVPPSHTLDRTACSFEPQALRHLGSRRR